MSSEFSRYSVLFNRLLIRYKEQEIREDGGEAMAEFPERQFKLVPRNNLRFFDVNDISDIEESEQIETPLSDFSSEKDINLQNHQNNIANFHKTDTLNKSNLISSCENFSHLDLMHKTEDLNQINVHSLNRSHEIQETCLEFSKEFNDASYSQKIKVDKKSTKISLIHVLFNDSVKCKPKYLNQSLFKVVQIQKVKNLKTLIEKFIKFKIIDNTVLLWSHLSYNLM